MPKAVRRQNQTGAHPLSGGYQPKNPSWGCQSCKERGRGEECNHCFAYGISGHVAREYTRYTRRRNQASRLGNGQRLFRRDTVIATSNSK